MFLSVGRDWAFDEGDEITLPLTPPSSRTIYLIEFTSHFLFWPFSFVLPFISWKISKLTYSFVLNGSRGWNKQGVVIFLNFHKLGGGHNKIRGRGEIFFVKIGRGGGEGLI